MRKVLNPCIPKARPVARSTTTSETTYKKLERSARWMLLFAKIMLDMTLNPRRYVTKTVTMSRFKGDSNQWLTCVWHRTLLKYASDSVFILTLFLTLRMNELIERKERSASVKPPCFDLHAVLCCILLQWRNWVLSLKCCLILLL